MPTPPLCSPFLRSPCMYTCRDKSLACLLGRLSSIYRVLEPSSTRRICALLAAGLQQTKKLNLTTQNENISRDQRVALGTQVKRSTRAAVRIAARVSQLLASYSYTWYWSMFRRLVLFQVIQLFVTFFPLLKSKKGPYKTNCSSHQP